jgi:hypothetical protein
MVTALVVREALAHQRRNMSRMLGHHNLVPGVSSHAARRLRGLRRPGDIRANPAAFIVNALASW